MKNRKTRIFIMSKIVNQMERQGKESTKKKPTRKYLFTEVTPNVVHKNQCCKDEKNQVKIPSQEKFQQKMLNQQPIINEDPQKLKSNGFMDQLKDTKVQPNTKRLNLFRELMQTKQTSLQNPIKTLSNQSQTRRRLHTESTKKRTRLFSHNQPSTQKQIHSASKSKRKRIFSENRQTSVIPQAKKKIQLKQAIKEQSSKKSSKIYCQPQNN